MVVYVKISDGLWNQLFQYAFALELQKRFWEKVVLDISSYEHNSYRNLEISHFNLECWFSTMSGTFVSHYLWRRNILLRFFNRIPKLKFLVFLFFEYVLHPFIFSKTFPSFWRQTIKQLTYWFDKKYFTKRFDYYLWYWQSEKYFFWVRNVLKKTLKLKETLDSENWNIIEQMQNSNSVVLHLRRGDYTWKWYPFRHPMYVCSLEYYVKAIDYFSTTLKDPLFFVFSDDIKRAKKMFSTYKNMIFVDKNVGKESYKDLWLMTFAKHLIISNSSFSRWGAYLNQNPRKKVIAPKIWFWHSEKETKDVIPEWRIKM